MESIVSVGIDIGTTTTQVAFSRLFLEDTAGYFRVPDIGIVQKQVFYCGTPCFTPMVGEFEIDAEKVRTIVENEYRMARQYPNTVATGAIIITGEAAKKRNAAALLAALSPLAGDFVAETAGPDLEAVIAGKGSGAATYSKNNHCRILNIDIGGGTSNAALFENGEPISTGCMEVGGRHIRTDSSGRIESMTKAAEIICERRGISLQPGDMNPDGISRFVAVQAEMLAMLAGLSPRDELFRELVTPGSADLDLSGGYDGICLSGGVSDAVYGAFASGDDFRFGDIGILLGRRIAQSGRMQSKTVVRPDETIRATVVGAGAHTVLVSGSTIFAAAESLPQRNIPVLHLSKEEYHRIAGGDAGLLEKRLKQLLCQRDEAYAAIACSGERDPSYEKVRSFASALVQGADQAMQKDAPLIVVLEEDMAKALGQALHPLTKRNVIAIDRVRTRANDRIDIGRLMMNGQVVSVVVKTLVFGR
ncbi:MAG: ethanolamine ammonia-lyase reactivating factor EutA [Eubacteriales bacterium]|nr:ethanolamine ammonia-lyase reactivating factor EutA [Eubacteriales bacterium]